VSFVPVSFEPPSFVPVSLVPVSLVVPVSVPESVAQTAVVEFEHATASPDAAARTVVAASAERSHRFLCEIGFVIVSGPFEKVFCGRGG
jgi:hypothetical protein